MTISYDDHLVQAVVRIGSNQFKDVSIKEIILGESLLTPGLQTAVTLQSFIYSDPAKDFKLFKNQMVNIFLANKLGKQMTVNQRVYRIDNRRFEPVNIAQTEEFTVHACDDTLLEDAKSIVSKSWSCTTPDEIVNYVLQSCTNAQQPNVRSAKPARDYIAEKIHPFQVIAQQSNVALDDDGDPSFLHYMTYDEQRGTGVHHWRSLKSLIKNANPVATFFHSEGNMDLANPDRAITFEFPCDFDMLSDILNGIDQNGNNLNQVNAINPLSGATQKFGGGNNGGCGKGTANHKSAITNKGTAKQQNSCEIDVEQHLLLRQARMSLLEKDKVSLRITVPWRPSLHVGQAINFKWMNKTNKAPVYGSGTYIISSLMHNIQFGGFSTTTLDCITNTITTGA